MAGKKFKQRKTDVIENGIVYRMYKESYSVYTYTEELPEKVIVADKVRDIPVTFLNTKCFYRSKCIEAVLPKNIKSIGSLAFGYCHNLESVTIPDTITIVQDDAFEKCKKLKHTSFSHGLYLGNTENPFLILNKNEKTDKPADGGELVVEVHPKTKFILNSTFNQFSPDSASYDKIDKLILHDELEYIGGGSFTMGFYGFDYAKIKTICVDSIEGLCRYGRYIPGLAKTLIVGGEEVGDTITIPASVTKITYQCFYMYNSLKTLRFEGNISEIGSEAFCRCKNLKEVYFPQKIGRIGIHAFSKCPALTKVDLYEVEKIDIGAFEREIPSWNGQKVEPTKDGLREINFHGCIRNLCERAFSNNSMLESVNDMDKVENIEGDPFIGTTFENKFVK